VASDSFPGFLKSKREMLEPICQLSEQELNHQHDANARILGFVSPNKPRNPERLRQITVRQVQIEKRLEELKNAREMDSITVGVENTSISAAEKMDVDNANPAEPKLIGAKARALQEFDRRMKGERTISPEEAFKLEGERNKADNEQREKRQSVQGLPQKDEKLTREQMASRINDFMNYKRSNSGEGSDSDSDDDPANWFSDEKDIGINEQQIVQPDNEDYSGVIRIDETKAYSGYSTFYEPRDVD